MKDFVVFFDLDGVVVRECGLADFGFAFILQIIDQYPSVFSSESELKVEQKYLDMVPKLLPKIKGLHPFEKLKVFKQFLNKYPEISDTDLVHIWYDAQLRYLYQNQTAEGFRIPGILQLLNYLKSQDRVFLSTATANERLYAEKMLQFAEVERYFDRVLAFDLGENRLCENKNEMLGRFVSSEMAALPIDLKAANFVFLGDGVNDIAAGKHIGALTLGIAHSEPHQKLLQSAGADAVFPVLSEGFGAVIRWFEGVLE